VHVWRAELTAEPRRSVLSPLTETPVKTLAAAGAYRPITPVRLLDTRSGGRLESGSTLTVPADTVVPAGATAVLANITVTDAAAAGYVTVWPSGQERPTASVVNPAAGETRANTAVVPLGADGRFLLYSSSPAHVIVDVSGFWAAVPDGVTREGRFVPVEPVRITDTRSAGPVAGQSSYPVVLPPVVPADASAVAVVVTVTEATGAGYWTAYPPGEVRPAVSTVNVTTGGTRANLAWVAPRDGAVEVFSQSGGHLVVDLVGYVTGAGAARASAGLLVPVTPARLVDTRTEAVQPGANTSRLVGGQGVRGLPTASGIAGNLTLVDAADAGYAVVWPEGAAVPLASNGNTARGEQAVAVAFTSRGGAAGAVSVQASVQADLVVDVTGYFTG
jgi:hypothetical protein